MQWEAGSGGGYKTKEGQGNRKGGNKSGKENAVNYTEKVRRESRL